MCVSVCVLEVKIVKYKEVNRLVNPSHFFCRQRAGGGALQLPTNRSRARVAEVGVLKIEDGDYTSCSTHLIKRSKKMPNEVFICSVSLPLLRPDHRAADVWRLWQHWGLPLQPGPKHSDLCTAVVLRLCLCTCASVCQANGFTGDGVGYLLPCVIECNDYGCCVMRF